jgi:microcystin-dependent protein
MSRNSGGTYTRPIVSGVIAGDDIRASDYNSEIDDISTALTDSLSRSGKGTMLANLDAGGFKVTNLGAATANGQAVRYDEFDAFKTLATATYAAKGANTDITSLNAPAIGAATATTQTVTDDSTKVATTAFVQDLADLLCPPGTIIQFSGTSAPAGFLDCPTTQTDISRTTYARLFAAIGTTWGNGDGSTTFGVPWFPVGYAALQG